MFIVNAVVNMIITVQERLFPRFNPFGWFVERAPPPVPVDYVMAGTYAAIVTVAAAFAFAWLRIRAGAKSGRGGNSRARTHREGNSSKSVDSKDTSDETVKCGGGSHKINVQAGLKQKENVEVELLKYDQQSDVEEKCRLQRASYAAK